MGLQMCSSSSQHARVAAWVLLPLLCFSTLLSTANGGGSRKLYIAYLGDVKHGHPDDVIASHHDMLATLLQSKEESLASMVYHYKHGFSGFVAMLTRHQARRLAEFPEVISVEPSRRIRATTTRSWDFLGLNYHSSQSHMPASELLHMSNFGEDVIIGVVDGGIWPESRSFSDVGYGPVPSRWKGECQTGPDWGINNCSRKIIGARFYSALVSDELLKTDSRSPRDNSGGHGTHTASTAAGSAVGVDGFHGLAAGVARGGAPRARIAVYKSLFAGGGSSASVLAAFDDAIHDGVDVLSLSLTAPGENSFGALHAVQKGITVVYSAGNDGPRPQTVEDTSPWVLTVAASKIDRSFPTVITLGNKQQMIGQSLHYQMKNNNSSSSKTSSFTEIECIPSCEAGRIDLDGIDFKGAIMVCLNNQDAINPLRDFYLAARSVVKGGGSGLIFAQYTTDAISFTVENCPGIACVIVDIYTSRRICQYVDDSSSPMAKIELTRTVTGKEVLAPKVAAFSSRGPSADYPAFIKPDVAAPGANILAAVGDSYEMMSGTSMAAPHVAGIAALLKGLHPDWSPAAIKSAIVTTAHVTDQRGMPILAEGLPRKVADPFDYGGGNINPCGAAHPGLIYDIDPHGYDKFFRCAIVKEGISTSASCNATTMLPAYNLNLPSISVPDLRSSIIVSRTVTNVGEVHSMYHVVVQSPAGVKMEVFPPVLVFDVANKVRKFDVKLSPMWNLQGDYTFGSITWQNDRQAVRIPVAARITIQDFYANVA